MRDIKFRAWSPSEKRVVPYEDFLLYDHGTEPVSFVMNLRGEPYNYKYMQFTGLKDKNGTDVYEGDYYTMPPHDDKSVRYEVKWGHSGFGLPDSQYMEVIGNIYENPELLKGDK